MLSAVDSRLAFDPAPVRIDPTLDNWMRHYKQALRQHAIELGLPDAFVREIGDIIVVPQWRYSGSWGRAEGGVRVVMTDLLRDHRLPILMINGLYDGIAPAKEASDVATILSFAAAQRIVWLDRSNLAAARYFRDGIHVARLRIGHQVTGDEEGRQDVHDAVGKLAHDVT